MTEDGRGIALPDSLDHWAAAQRWFGGTGRIPALVGIGRWTLPTDESGVLIRTELVVDSTAVPPTLYQVPLTERVNPLPGGEHALIGMLGDAYVYDGPVDAAYSRALLRFILEEKSSPGARGELLFEGESALRPPTMASSRVLSGEQSNTSIIYDCIGDDGRPARPIICKVFRAVHDGENPDISVQSALARAGSRHVPEPVGCVVGHWQDPAAPGTVLTGHLAFAQEFLPGVEDAWRSALREAAAGTDFTVQARELGEATAAVHADLASVMPTRDATPAVIAAELDSMRERFLSAATEVPALAGFRTAIEAVLERARLVPWPRLQRIHGDYHLGQVLEVPGRGWVLVDFEGEPLRPLADRTQPDVPLKDVAGMLRSFSYVAGTARQSYPAHRAEEADDWASACRQAFLEGYAVRSGTDLQEQKALLDAFELDKALYEAVYETRNRPSWLPIPLAAIRALAAEVTARSIEAR
ncbi:phosphotransferase [Cryobacterium sp. TMT1-21]|uniref:maltokinase N-terminal cap-like domain-containing protein n=1 Tax=unclassified Cryobacterium TaxID=2649013 RepID=UPI00106CE9C6|nr:MULTISPECIES: phosphotransferase [unclassified Cryobacterium]TFD15695.1 phosphotransferase [Cryobacterium sp. TMT1-21]TFD18994.1 phosphotransferase [Cryobacterium sp. TMT2-23]